MQKYSPLQEWCESAAVCFVMHKYPCILGIGIGRVARDFADDISILILYNSGGTCLVWAAKTAV